MEEEEETSSGGVKWSVKVVDTESSNDGEVEFKFETTTTPPNGLVELQNTADNTDNKYYGNEAFELLNFENVIKVEYEQPESGSSSGSSGTTTSFQPDYEKSTVNIIGALPLNLNYSISIYVSISYI